MARLNDERFTVWLDLVKREAPPTRFQQLLFVAERRRRAPYLTQFTFGGFFWLATSEEAQRLYQILPELNRADEARIRATVPTSVAAELARLSGGAEYRSGGLYGGDISPELSLKTILGVSETCGSMADLRARWRLFPEGVRLQLLRQFPRRSSFDEALVRVLCAGDGAERKEFAADLLLPDGWGWLAGGMPDEEVAYLQRALDELTVEQRRQASRLLGPNVRSQLAKLQTRMQTSALFSNDEELKRAFDRTADASVDVLAELADERFSMRFVGLDATALRRAWKVLEGLPAAQVARALELVGGLDPSKGAVGEWRGDQIAIADIAKLGTGEDRTTFNRHGIHKDRRFDQVLRHEVGHAVDEELGASATYCKTEAGGGWREHADMPALAREMILHSNSVIAHWPDPAQRELLIQALAEAIPREGAAPADYLAPVYALQGTFPKAEFSKLFDDPVFEAIRRGRDSEWWNGYPALGPRCYSKSHYGGWQSYLAAARDRKVSVYQFFASPEWFAEAYAAFYAPGYGDDPAKDNALLRVDPGSHVYFMTHVHTHQRKGES